jgi:hypothetical protein
MYPFLIQIYTGYPGGISREQHTRLCMVRECKRPFNCCPPVTGASNKRLTRWKTITRGWYRNLSARQQEDKGSFGQMDIVKLYKHHNTDQLIQSNILRWHVEDVRTLSVNVTVESSRAHHLWRRYPRVASCEYPENTVTRAEDRRRVVPPRQTHDQTHDQCRDHATWSCSSGWLQHYHTFDDHGDCCK